MVTGTAGATTYHHYITRTITFQQRSEKEMATREEMIEYINSKLAEADDRQIEEYYWFFMMEEE